MVATGEAGRRFPRSVAAVSRAPIAITTIWVAIISGFTAPSTGGYCGHPSLRASGGIRRATGGTAITKDGGAISASTFSPTPLTVAAPTRPKVSAARTPGILIRPASSRPAYCSGRCITGLAGQHIPGSTGERGDPRFSMAIAGVGRASYSGASSATFPAYFCSAPLEAGAACRRYCYGKDSPTRHLWATANRRDQG